MSGAALIDQFSTGDFRITDSSGGSLPVGGWGDIACDWSIERDSDCRDFSFQVDAGATYRPLVSCAAYSDYRDMSSTVATWANLADPGLTSIVITIDGLFGIRGARWRIPIAH
jgi:hypothetical protein